MVGLAEAKEHLRVTHDHEDALIAGYLGAAYAALEGERGATGRTLRIDRHELLLPTWPSEAVRLPWPPVIAVNGVDWIDAAGNKATLPETAWHFVARDALQLPCLIVRDRGEGGLADIPQPITVRYTAGYEVLPRDLAQAILLLVGHYYANREAVTDAPMRELPLGVAAIADRYRVYA